MRAAPANAECIVGASFMPPADAMNGIPTGISDHIL